MFYNAIATNGQRKVSENLDNALELQEYMNKMEQRGFLQVAITATGSTGSTQKLTYNFTGTEWVK